MTIEEMQLLDLFLIYFMSLFLIEVTGMEQFYNMMYDLLLHNVIFVS